MANKLAPVERKGSSPNYIFQCPGCGDVHGVWLSDNPNELTKAAWSWNGSLDEPTISPSILVTAPYASKTNICHSFVCEGMIQFLDDCTHELKGQTVELPDWQDEFAPWRERS